jgi:Bacterial extracellular solute-binding protein/von Willebrand factor type A domain
MGRHRARREWRTGHGALVAVVAIGLVAVGLVLLVPDRNAGAAGAPAPCPDTLRVVTAASFAPVLDALAPALATGPGCSSLDVVVADGRAAAAQVTASRADLWIPDDGAWAARSDGPALAGPPVPHAGAVVAVSPLYLVTDAPTADRITAAGGGWLGLAGLLAAHQATLAIADPATTGDGLLAAAAVGSAVRQESGPAAATAALADTQPSVRTAPTGRAALPAAAGEVGVVPEHAVLPEISAGHTVGTRVLAPTDHTAALRYTWLPAASAAADPAAADRLARLWHALTGPGSTAALASAGLRAPGVGLAPDARPGELPNAESPFFDPLAADQVDQVFATWYPQDRRADVLAVVDVSGSMAAGAAGGGRLIDQERAGVQGLADLLPDDARLGLWEFGAGLAPPSNHRELLGTTELSPDGRAAAGGAVSALAPLHTGSGLHDTVLAAYTAARDGNRAGVPAVVVVFTDGHDEDAPGSPTREQLAGLLAAAQDPARPVRLSIVTFGEQADAARLAAALAPLGVDVRHATGPDQVRAAFLDATVGARTG